MLIHEQEIIYFHKYAKLINNIVKVISFWTTPPIACYFHVDTYIFTVQMIL